MKVKDNGNVHDNILLRYTVVFWEYKFPPWQTASSQTYIHKYIEHFNEIVFIYVRQTPFLPCSISPEIHTIFSMLLSFI